MALGLLLSADRTIPRLRHRSLPHLRQKRRALALGKSFYQGTERRSPGDPSQKFIRAIDIHTGKIAWEIPNIGGGPLDSGLMATAGGFLFYADANGAIVAADATNGKILWHFETGQQFKGSPMTYTIDGHQRLVLIAGQTILSLGLR